MKIIFVGSEVALCLGAGARVRAPSILVVFPLCRRKCSSCFSMVAIYLEELWWLLLWVLGFHRFLSTIQIMASVKNEVCFQDSRKISLCICHLLPKPYRFNSAFFVHWHWCPNHTKNNDK